MVEQPARPALLPLLLLQPTRLIALTGFHRPSLSFSLVANGVLHSYCALSLSSFSSISRAFSFSCPSSRFFFALPLRDEAGKKGNDMEKIRYESGEHRKKWHRGRKLLRRRREKRSENKRDNETSDGNPRRLAIYLFRRAPRFPFMTTVKFTPRVNNELNPFFSSFQQATNPRI